MGLKGFHVIFIFCSIALSFGFALWARDMHDASQAYGYFLTACISALIGVGLIIYAVLFIKKVKAL